MRLEIKGTLDDPHVYDAETGQELEGVERVELTLGRDRIFRKCSIRLDRAAIDISVPAGAVEAVTRDGTKFAHSRLLDIRGLRWIRRSAAS